VLAKKHVFGSEGFVAGMGCQTLACTLAIMVLQHVRLKPNGPAIKGGCVTRRKHRAGSRYFSRKVVTVQGGYGMCFCSHGTRFNKHYVRRGTNFLSGREAILEQDFYKCALAQCRGTICLGARNLSLFRISIAGS
jgi:hypothetical protein